MRPASTRWRGNFYLCINSDYYFMYLFLSLVIELQFVLSIMFLNFSDFNCDDHLHRLRSLPMAVRSSIERGFT